MDGEELGPITQEDYNELLVEMAEEQAEEEDLPADFPTAKKERNMFTLFENILAMKENSKVGNLGTNELGDLLISVRDCQKIDLLSDTLHHKEFGSFFDKLGQITLATSMSKKGWLVENVVTQRRIQQKRTIDTIEQPSSMNKKGWGWRTRNR